MSANDDLYAALLDRLSDPYTRERIRRALALDLVLDTWLNGEREESFTEEAQEIILRAADDLTRQAVETGAVFPGNAMPEGYVRLVFQELLSSTALYQAQKYKGVREVDPMEAAHAEAIVREFVVTEEAGLTGAACMYFAISAHEDLNAIHYYHRMRREDFLLGRLHRPWSDMMLTNQLDVYLRAGVIKGVFTSDGDMLQLTDRGEETLRHLRQLLLEAGEFEWRSNAQRWVIFGETDYDQVFQTVFPDTDAITREYIHGLPIPKGARVLEIGAGTGRATVDLGLAARVAKVGGTLIAMEPSAALIQALRRKCVLEGLDNVQIMQGVVETLPFPDNSFDLVVSVAVLHFTDLHKAATEMVRVTRPSGMVSAGVPLSFSAMEIPMVASWFQPLKLLADEIGVPFGERLGLPRGATEEAFRLAGLEGVTSTLTGGRVTAREHRSFLQFMLKGAAFYQNILSRLPFKERWAMICLLEERGNDLVESTTQEEQQRFWYGEIVHGRKPDSATTNVSSTAG